MTRRAWALAAAIAAVAASLTFATDPVSAAMPAWVPVQQQDGAGNVHHPLAIRVKGQIDAVGTPLLASLTPGGYTPAQMKAYLGLTGDGTGQTIAIVAAYDHPTIASDLAKFNTTYGLPAPPSFKKVTQTGATSKYPRSDPGWALEIAMDVQWAHAIAPKASILLVEANSSSFADMNTAVAYAAKQSTVSVISNSWGAKEFNGETTQDSYCKQAAKLCVFSSGDYGNPGTYPGFSPYVLSVGGTSLTLSTTTPGAVTSETAWSGSGGGVSVYEPRPAYQAAVNPNQKRGMPDVCYNADPVTGIAVYSSVAYQGQVGWFQMGGTSAGAPQWAAIIAIANQTRLALKKTVLAAYPSATIGFKAHNAIYGLTSGLGDITSGTNGLCGALCTAGPGYDFVTGRGSPRPGIDTALAAAP